jgi:hypothetical protein
MATKPTTEAGALLPGEVSGALNLASAETILKNQYAAEWGFWNSDPSLLQLLESTFKQKLDDGSPNPLYGVLNVVAQGGAGAAAAANKFNKALEKTNWYKANGSQALAAATVKYTQPTTWEESLANRKTFIKNTATDLGYQLSDNTLNKLTETSLYQAYNPDYFGSTDQQSALRTSIAKAAIADKVDITTGKGVNDLNQLKEYATQMGVTYGSDWYNQAGNDMADPSSQKNLDFYKNTVKTAALSKYSGFAGQINQGLTVSQIADPYIQEMAKTLELPSSSISLTDPLITKAMGTSMSPDGIAQATPLWQFSQQLRQDPRWAYTNNARDYVNGVVHQIGKDFGFVS